MSVSQLAYLDELVAHDEAAARGLVELDELMNAVATLRSSAEFLLVELEEGPAVLERCETEVCAAVDKLDAARSRLDGALREELEQREADDPERLRAAELRVARERDSVGMAEKNLAAAQERRDERRTRLAEANAERPRLEQQASDLAETLADRPRLPASVSIPPGGIARVREWAVEARAALFVARSAVANEREQAIRQAGELGALVTGSPVSASSMDTLVSVIRRAVSP